MKPEDTEYQTSDTVDHELDLDTLKLDASIVDLHQEGNWLHGVTDKGVRFRQHIKQGKRLNKIGGRFVIQNVDVV